MVGSQEVAGGSRQLGGRFFLIGRDRWRQVLEEPREISSAHRLQRMLSYLVLACGTGKDNASTTWSAKAIETYTGVGKPRAALAIQALMRGTPPLLALGPGHSKMKPRYLLSAFSDENPIFLPNALVTGFGSETPVFRRMREIGCPTTLALLIYLYGTIALDATYGVPLAVLRRSSDRGDAGRCRKLFEAGPHSVWSLDNSGQRFVSKAMTNAYSSQDHHVEDHVQRLERIGVLTYEPWIFDGEGVEAEPLFPVSLFEPIINRPAAEPVEQLTWAAQSAAEALIGDDRRYLQDRAGPLLIPLPAHHQPPSLQLVARLRVEADTLGSRLAYAKRMGAIERWTTIYERLNVQAASGTAEPIRTGAKPSPSSRSSRSNPPRSTGHFQVREET
jgi:hypothetical protein